MMLGGALLLTVPSETVERAIRLTVADDLGVDSRRVSVIRVTRKRGGGVTADVSIAPQVESETPIDGE